MPDKKDQKPTNFITPEVVCSYPNLFQPAPDLSGNMKYSVSCPIPKTDKKFLKQLDKLIANAVENKWGSKGLKLLNTEGQTGIILPLVDADKKGKEDELYENTTYFNAKGNTKPGIVKASPNGLIAVTNEDDVYPGCIIRVSGNFYGTDKGGEKRVAVGLNNVLLVRDGERIGGKPSATSDFGDMNDEYADSTQDDVDDGDLF